MFPARLCCHNKGLKVSKQSGVQLVTLRKQYFVVTRNISMIRWSHDNMLVWFNVYCTHSCNIFPLRRDVPNVLGSQHLCSSAVEKSCILWWSGDLSRVYHASWIMTAGFGCRWMGNWNVTLVTVISKSLPPKIDGLDSTFCFAWARWTFENTDSLWGWK